MLARPRRGAEREATASPAGRVAGDPAILAYLTATPSRALCYYAPCSHVSTVALCDFTDTVVATYCAGHGRLALREYGQALEQRLAEERDSRVA